MSTHDAVARTGASGPTRMPETLASTEAKLVYHSLDAVGAGSVDELVDRLGLKKLTLYGVLDSLHRRDLVEKSGDRYVSARTV